MNFPESFILNAIEQLLLSNIVYYPLQFIPTLFIFKIDLEGYNTINAAVDVTSVEQMVFKKSQKSQFAHHKKLWIGLIYSTLTFVTCSLSNSFLLDKCNS